MTDLTTHRSIPVSGVRSTYSQRRRWRGLNTLLSGTVGTLVLTSAVYLGVTGPPTSPVSPPAAAAPSSGATAGDGTTPDVVPGDDQQQGGRDRPDQRDRGDGPGGRGRQRP